MRGTGFRRTLPIDFRLAVLWCARVGVVGVVGVWSGSVGVAVLPGVVSGVKEGVEQVVYMVSLSVDRSGRDGRRGGGVEGRLLVRSDIV